MSVVDLLNTAIQHHQSGNIQEAEGIYKEVLNFDSNNLDALYLLGVVSHQKGYLDDALVFLNKAVNIKPMFELYKLLGDVYLAKNEINQAILAYQKSVEFDPEFVEGFYNLGLLYHSQNNLEEAVKYYKKTLELKPDAADIYNNLGSIFYKKNQVADAIENYLKALYFEPDNSNAYFNLGNLYRKVNKQNDAIEYFQKGLELSPNDAEAHYCLGISYLLNKECDKALNFLNKSLDLGYRPDEVYLNIANTYFEKDDYDLAEQYYNKALSINPNYAVIYNNLGIMYKFKNELDKAIEYYKIAVEKDPDDLQTRYNLARAYITLQNFDEGWKYFGCRDEMYESSKKGSESLLKKDWKDDIKGKTIFVNQSGGFGDAILFSRYLPLLQEKGARVVTKLQDVIRDLLVSNDIKAEVFDYSVPDSEIQYDARICNLCLPCYFKSNLETIPNKQAYLKADADKVKIYKEKFFDNNYFKVGIVWNTGTKSDKEGDNRTASLKYFLKLARINNVKLYSLQKGNSVEELNDLSQDIEIINLGETFKDFSDTAAAIENLDLVIGVDTAVTNLSGALGKSTWMLLPFIPEWRWLLDAEYAPWYESVKLFRQKAPGSWQELLDRVYNELKTGIKH
ncbi:MAG: hypothetical protein A2287_07925 [Candidatus Melainabacteria bacterium RIFOXYA12_FULL_32_12]|nr:MAG: hypothetical protein A2255_03545 [Candidatus Melainabacteria bacterium RIFOXYA2_FULL_32_9]OGI29790.1 MAG: hypothetical protein A2287_07925 [Candidatus Melainabacteria bacterium RIFOXYA12_FULL_32_12]